jgi:hypothetical protein
MEFERYTKILRQESFCPFDADLSWESDCRKLFFVETLSNTSELHQGRVCIV